MEIPRKIYMDVENRRVYLAIEVNKNRYNEMTGAQPGVDNSNVAIICYEWTHGTRRWISMLGSSIYSDVWLVYQMCSWISRSTRTTSML